MCKTTCFSTYPWIRTSSTQAVVVHCSSLANLLLLMIFVMSFLSLFFIFESHLHSLSLCLGEEYWHAKEKRAAWEEKEAKSKNKNGWKLKKDGTTKLDMTKLLKWKRREWREDAMTLSIYMPLMKEGDGWANLHGSNETLWLSFIIQCSFLTSLPLCFPESISPPSPVSEFLQCPLDVHSMPHTCHS